MLGSIDNMMFPPGVHYLAAFGISHAKTQRPQRENNSELGVLRIPSIKLRTSFARVIFFPLRSNFDLTILADDDVVVDDHGHPSDDSFQPKRAKHSLAGIVGKSVSIGSGAYAKMHRAVALLIAAHDAGARRTLLVGSKPHFAAYGVGIFVTVFFQVRFNLLGFQTTAYVDYPSVFYGELHRVFPNPRGMVGCGIPHHRAVGSARHRLDVDFSVRPGATAEMFAVSLERHLAGSLEVKIFRITGNVGGEIGAIFGEQSDFFAAVVDGADSLMQLDHLFEIIP